MSHQKEKASKLRLHIVCTALLMSGLMGNSNYIFAQNNSNSRYGIAYNVPKSIIQEEANYDTKNVTLSPEVLAQLQQKSNNVIKPLAPSNPLPVALNVINPQIAAILAQKQQNFKAQQVQKVQKPFANVVNAVDLKITANTNTNTNTNTNISTKQLQHQPIPEFQAKSYPTIGLYAANNTTIAGDYLVLEPEYQNTKTLDLTIKPEDIWSRIRRGYAIPNIDTELVAQKEQYYASKPDYLQRIGERSGKYMYYILEELEKRGMPTELALLPIIESAYNPGATSPVGAAGIWQFMPGTGRWFNLKQDSLQDERLSIIASTKAALDYLQYLYNFHGDWHLALASYNWGEGSVQKAVQRNKAANLATNYLSLTMPRETKEYIPKLQAIKNIINQPNKFGIDLPIIANSEYFNTVLVEGYVNFEELAQLAQISISELKALNPWIKGNTVQNKRILLPIKAISIFENNIKNNEQYKQRAVPAIKPIENNDVGSNENASSFTTSLRNKADSKVQIAPNWQVSNNMGVNAIAGDIVEYKLPSIYASTTNSEEDSFGSAVKQKTAQKVIEKVVQKTVYSPQKEKQKGKQKEGLQELKELKKVKKNKSDNNDNNDKNDKNDKNNRKEENKNSNKSNKSKKTNMNKNTDKNTDNNNIQQKISKKEIQVVRIDPYERIKQNNEKGAAILKQQLQF